MRRSHSHGDPRTGARTDSGRLLLRANTTTAATAAATPLQRRELARAERTLEAQIEAAAEDATPPGPGPDKAQRLLAHALDELLSTERSYVDGLRRLQAAAAALRRDWRLRELAAKAEAALSTAGALLHLNEALLARLEAAGADAERVCAELQPFAELFAMYGEFAVHHSPLSEELELHDGHGDHRELASLLILPIQRLPRYLLLLGEARKHARPGSAAAAALAACHDAVRQAAMAVNERVRAADQLRELWRLRDSFDDARHPVVQALVQPGRWVVKQGRLVAPADHSVSAADGAEAAERRRKVVHLLNDTLLVSAPAAGSSLRLRSVVPLTAATLVAKLPDAAVADTWALQVVSPLATAVLVARSQPERDAWAAALQECVDSANARVGETVRSTAQRPAASLGGVLAPSARKLGALLGDGPSERRGARRARNMVRLHEIESALATGEDREVDMEGGLLAERRRWFLREGLLTLVADGGSARLVKVVLFNDLFLVASVCGGRVLRRITALSLGGDAFLRDAPSPPCSFIVDDGRQQLTLCCESNRAKQAWLRAVARASQNFAHGVYGGESGDESDSSAGTASEPDPSPPVVDQGRELLAAALGRVGEGRLENTSFLASRLAGSSSSGRSRGSRRGLFRARRGSDDVAPSPDSAAVIVHAPQSDLAAARREQWAVVKVSSKGRRQARTLQVDGEALRLSRADGRLFAAAAKRRPTVVPIDDVVAASLVAPTVVQVQAGEADVVVIVEAQTQADAACIVTKVVALMEMDRARRLELHERFQQLEGAGRSLEEGDMVL